MFKHPFEGALNSHPLKSSHGKAIRAKIVETYPRIEGHIDEIWPSKAAVLQLKIKGDNLISFYQVDGTIVFMEIRDYPIIPMLRVLHQYPFMMDHMQCDSGAIKHIFSGSHVMAPGLTSEGGKIHPGLLEKAPIAIMAEGKEHAMGLGVLSQSSDKIAQEKKGQAIEVLQFINDAVWKLRSI